MATQHVGAGHVLPSTNGGPPSAAEHDDMENTTELRLMRAFAKRRRPQDERLVAHGNETSGIGPPAVPPSVEEAEPKKKKSFKKGLLQIFSCVRAPKGAVANEGGQDGESFRSHGPVSGVEDKKEETQASERVDELATMLIELANNSFIPPEIEADSEDDEIEKLAGLLLRQCGDTVQEKYDKMFRELLSSYSKFDNLMSTIFHRIGLPTPDPGDQGPKDSDEIKTNIAVTCEVASRLNAMEAHPMNRVLGFGARYLKEHYPLEAALNAAEDPDSENDVE